MKNMIKVLWYIIVSAMVLAMFVMVTSKVFAHGEGKCITDPSGNVFLGDDSWVKIVGHLKGDEVGYKRPMKRPSKRSLRIFMDIRSSITIGNDNPTAPSTSFWDIDFDDPNSPYYGVFDKFYVDCPTAPRATKYATPTVTTTTAATTTGVTPIESPGYYDSYRYSHQWDFNESPYIGFPVLPGTTKTVSGYWNRIKTAAGEPVTIQVPVEGVGYI